MIAGNESFMWLRTWDEEKKIVLWWPKFLCTFAFRGDAFLCPFFRGWCFLDMCYFINVAVSTRELPIWPSMQSMWTPPAPTNQQLISIHFSYRKWPVTCSSSSSPIQHSTSIDKILYDWIILYVLLHHKNFNEMVLWALINQN